MVNISGASAFTTISGLALRQPIFSYAYPLLSAQFLGQGASLAHAPEVFLAQNVQLDVHDHVYAANFEISREHAATEQLNLASSESVMPCFCITQGQSRTSDNCQC